MVYEASGTIDSAKAARLKDICDSVNIAFFYPIVYRVDLSKIHRSRSNVAGSGLAGSAEVLVPDLQETEFDVLFLDYTVDIDFRRLVVDEYLGQNTTLPLDALRTLEARC